MLEIHDKDWRLIIKGSNYSEMRFQDFIAMSADVVACVADNKGLRCRDAGYCCAVVRVAEEDHLPTVSLLFDGFEEEPQRNWGGGGKYQKTLLPLLLSLTSWLRCALIVLLDYP
jgi:hypothetical protein